MAEKTLVRRHCHLSTLYLVPRCVTPQLPDALADLRDGLGGDGFAEAGKASGGVDRHPSTNGRDPVT